jgi:hypothetical protein
MMRPREFELIGPKEASEPRSKEGSQNAPKIFSTRQAAYDWLADHDPEGVAWEYPIETDIPRRAPTRAKTGMAHLDRADSDLFGSRYGR